MKLVTILILFGGAAAAPDGAGHHGHHGEHHDPTHGAHHTAPQHHPQGAPHHAPHHAPPQVHHAAPHHNVPHKVPQRQRLVSRPGPVPRPVLPKRAPLRGAPRGQRPVPLAHRQVPRRRPAPFRPQRPQHPFLAGGKPRPERSQLPPKKNRFPPQKGVRQPLGNVPQAVPTKTHKPIKPPGKTLATELKENEHFSTLYTALKAANMITALDKTSQDYTVFAPTNAAFDKVPVDTLNSLLSDKEALRKVLFRHVIPNKHLAGKEIPNGVTKLTSGAGEEVKTDRGKYVQVSSNNGNAFVVKFDFPASNGVYHAIDQVLK